MPYSRVQQPRFYVNYFEFLSRHIKLQSLGSTYVDLIGQNSVPATIFSGNNPSLVEDEGGNVTVGSYWCTTGDNIYDAFCWMGLTESLYGFPFPEDQQQTATDGFMFLKDIESSDLFSEYPELYQLGSMVGISSLSLSIQFIDGVSFGAATSFKAGEFCQIVTMEEHDPVTTEIFRHLILPSDSGDESDTGETINTNMKYFRTLPVEPKVWGSNYLNNSNNFTGFPKNDFN